MNKLVILLVLASMNCIAKDKAEIRYAGQGRYTCSGDSYQCAQIDANNRALESREKERDEARMEQREREQRRGEFERDTGGKSRK